MQEAAEQHAACTTVPADHTHGRRIIPHSTKQTTASTTTVQTAPALRSPPSTRIGWIASSSTIPSRPSAAEPMPRTAPPGLRNPDRR